MWVLSSAPIAAAEPTGQDAREALSDADLPWYDPHADRIRVAPLAEEPPLRRPSNWQWDDRSSTKRSTRLSDFWRLVLQGLQYLVWIALAVLFTALAYLWMRAVARHERDRYWQQLSEEQRRRHEAASIEQLPIPVKRPQADLLVEARRLYQTQRYNEAIVYLFSYQLVQLDRHQCVELAKGKTNRQYVAELHGEPYLARQLTQTMLTFEDAFFGRHPLSRERFEACWSGVDEFNQYLRQLAATPRESRQSA
jgi:hypothetical protein